MAGGRNLEHFLLGTGTPPETHQCAECGYEHTKKKLFKRGDDDGTLTCSTGHYEKDGQLKRARNPYAQRQPHGPL